nr:reverse transcriptase domain-containing protein [Tanacetum cinerariifolium]
MVAYLLKSDASGGFNQIINFLNGIFIKYALTVNPNIYVSCIKQFWTTVAVKKVNDVIRLQALVDKKKVMLTEATILEALRLDDAEGVECLPNEEIFVELARMGYEKPSTKLTLVRHVDSPSKFYMYPRFLQLIIRKQVGKGFSRVDTPLFEGMLVEQQVVEEGDTEVHGEEVNAGDVAEGDVSAAHGEVPTADKKPSIPSPTPPTPPQQPSQDIPLVQPYEEELSTWNLIRLLKRVETSDETMMNDVSNQGRMIAEMDQDVNVVLEDDKEEDESEPAKVQEVVDVVTTAKIITKVVTAASETITATSTTITAPEAQVPTATLIAAPSRKRKGVVIKDPEEESTTSTIIPAETKSMDKGKEILVEEPKPLKKQQQIKQDEKYARELEAELNKNIDWDEAINHVNKKAKEDNAVKRYQAMKRKPQTKAQARKNMMVYLKNVAGFKMDYFKRMSYDDIRPIFERYFDSNVAFLQKTKEQIEEKESKALKRLNETPAEKAAKQQKLDEEVKELKRHLQIVPNEDDDVYTEATPLDRKVPVVDYDIIKLNNKPYYKIIRADGGTFMKRHPEECYDLIENITAHHNDWDTSSQRNESSHSITSSFDTEITALKAEMAKINKILMRVLQVNQQVKAVTPSCETCGGPHSFSDCPSTVGNTQNVYAAGSYQDNSYQPQGNRKLLSYRSENYLGPSAYQAPVYQALVHQPQIPQPQVVTTNEFTNFIKANDAIIKNMKTNMTSLTNSNLELKNMFGQSMKMNTASSLGLGNLPLVERETKETKDTVHPTNNRSTKDVQPSIVQIESLILNSDPIISPIIEPIASPDLNFNISFVDALIQMPKFGPFIKSLLTNKDKLFDLAKTLLNEHCLTVLLKKFLEKLGDPGKFLIPCDFPIMVECLALVDLGASINLMPLSVWNKLSFLDLSPTCMTLELADHLISHLVGVTEDVFVKVGTFHFPADFVVVDFNADPRVPQILRRSFLKTGRALINVFKGELTLRVGKEAITFNLDQTLRCSVNYNDLKENRIGPTSYFDPIASTTSPTLTPFRNSDFLLEEVDAFLALEDDPNSPEVYQSYVNTEGDILLLEAFLNDDPSLPPPNQGNYLPQVRKELKICEAKTDKSSIDEPPEVELKDLPLHLKYVFLKGDDKFPVIIEKDLSVEEKTALITVLKSHKRAIAWKLSNIKGINPEFCTHKILMEEDFEPVVQHQRRVNPKIHDDIKNEVLKLLDTGLIYPISNSLWEKTTFTCLYGTFAYCRMPFVLCNAPGTFQRCMMAIFLDMIEKLLKSSWMTSQFLGILLKLVSPI